eukprot:TRINITY_DN9255_c0_g1_i1.p1 TRINITY_DN9255_c0_g1~~TRINITY_DN9255_c0_g1_i1.p1  ORF type:complete len:148 (-),score=46.44 TRINITY_DN9255_c0_g1_i1:213-656(-)
MKPLIEDIADIGLPARHPQIPVDLLRKPNITGQPAIPSSQGSFPVCASHAVAKAIVEIIDEKGYDCDQNAIVAALVHPNQEAKNPDYFNGSKIKIKITKKSGDHSTGEIELEINVQTQGANVGSDLEFNLNPLIPLPEAMKMVLRWD